MLETVTEKLLRAGGPVKLARMPLGVLAIVTANLSLLFLFVVLDLSLFELMTVYWWETLWISLFCVLKILVASIFGSPYDSINVHVSAGSSLFFSVIAIGVVGGQFLGFFLLIGFFISFVFHVLTGLEPGELWFKSLGPVFAASLVLLIGHALSFVSNFLIRREYQRASVGALLALPFKRCFAIFAAVGLAFLGAVLIPGFSNSIGFAVLLIPIKLGLDYLSHRVERQAFQVTEG